MISGVVQLFLNDPIKRYGFIKLNDGIDIFFHYNSGRRPLRAFDGNALKFVKDTNLRDPKKGDKLVLETEVSPKGIRAKIWAFEEDYDAAISDMFSTEMFRSVTNGHPGLTHGIKQSVSVLRLVESQLSIFLQNTPEGKVGADLWQVFQSRQAKNDRDDYTFVTFFEEVLAEAGYPYVRVSR